MRRCLRIRGQNESLCDHSLLCSLNLKERPQDHLTQSLPPSLYRQGFVCRSPEKEIARLPRTDALVFLFEIW